MKYKYCPHCMCKNSQDAVWCINCHQDLNITNEVFMLPIGTILHDRYLVGKYIGQGGAGITYIGLDQVLQIPIAIKEYFPDSMVKRNNTVSLNTLIHNDEETVLWYEKFKARFLEEARILAGLAGNSNLVYVSDLFEENETAYFIMEYVAGESLSDWLRTRGQIPFDEAYQLLKPIIRTLSYINSQGLIHRDISPSNIMIQKNGNAKLLDFGAAREFTNAGEKSISIVLKPGYAPQEQYNTRGIQGPWTDVYALCATIYKMITGQIPENALNRMFEDELAIPSALSAVITPAQEAVLMKGLAVRPKDRIQNMDELLEKFEASCPMEKSVEKIRDEEDDERTLMAPMAKPSRLTQSQVSKSVPELMQKEVISKAQPALEPEQPITGKTKSNKHVTGIAEQTPKSGKRKRKPLRILLAAATVVIVAVGLFSANGINRKTGKSTTSTVSGVWTKSFQDCVSAFGKTITVEDMETVRDYESIYMTECEIDQAAIDYLGANSTVKTVDITACTGIKTLDPLADIEELTDLKYGGNKDNPTDIEESTFTKEFPQVKSLQLHNAVMKDEGAFLSHFSGLTRLWMSDIDQFKALPVFGPGLHTLTIRGVDCKDIDLTSIGACSELYDLTIEDCNLSEISFLTGECDPRTVNLDKNQLISLAGLEGKSISSLSVNGNQLTSLDGLQDNVTLSSLEAAQNKLTDISALANVTNLEWVDLGKNEITDLSPLAGAVGMKSLKLYKNQISDISPLSDMKKLNELVVNDNQLENLDGCWQMIHLEKLVASDNLLISITGLSNCTILQKVNLAHNQLTDASTLGKSAEALQLLSLEDNQLTDISFMKGSAELTALSINENAVTSLAGLEDSIKLKMLSAHHNALTSISALSGSDELYFVDLANNDITDITAISQKEASDRVLILSNNKISNISSLRTDTLYSVLALHGNPIKDFSVLADMVNMSGNEEISVSWNEDDNLLIPFAEHYNGSKVDVVEAPLDKQVGLNRSFADKYKEIHESGAGNIPFFTAEKIEQRLDMLRDLYNTNKLEAIDEYTSKD